MYLIIRDPYYKYNFAYFCVTIIKSGNTESWSLAGAQVLNWESQHWVKEEDAIIIMIINRSSGYNWYPTDDHI